MYAAVDPPTSDAHFPFAHSDTRLRHGLPGAQRGGRAGNVAPVEGGTIEATHDIVSLDIAGGHSERVEDGR